MEVESQVNQLLIALKEREEVIADLREKLKDLHREILDREGLVAIAEEQLAQHHQIVNALSIDLQFRQESIATTKSMYLLRLNSLCEELAYMNRELELRQNTIESILNTRSWRIMAPARWAARLVQTLDNLFVGKEVNSPAPTDSKLSPLSSRNSDGVLRHDYANEIEQISEDVISVRHGITYVHRLIDNIETSRLDIKAIAFFETEGADSGINAAINAMPRYLGHYQPRLPDDSVINAHRFSGRLYRQVEFARQYGFYGFSFIQAWPMMDGKLESPILQFLSDPDLNLQFCLCLNSQNHDDRIRDNSTEITLGSTSLPPEVFLDSRYIRIHGKLLLILSGVETTAAPAMVDDLRRLGRNLGLPEFFIVVAQMDESINPEYARCDAVVDFPPHFRQVPESTNDARLTDLEFNGRIYDYSDVVEQSLREPERDFINFRTILPGWDDEPSRAGGGTSLRGTTTALYAKWLREGCRRAMAMPSDERLIFVRSWNDWKNGCYLEPDRRFGYAFLHATANVLRSYHTDDETRKLIESINLGFVRSSDTAIIFHCHYEDLIPAVFDGFLSQAKGADLFLTVRNDVSLAAVREIYRRRPNVYFLCNENRGRDVRPFLLALRHIASLGYTIGCKLHTKRTPQSEYGYGDSWRHSLMQALLGSPESIAKAAAIFAKESDVGLLAPKGSVMDLSPRHVHIRNIFWLDYLFERIGRRDLVGNYAIKFPAGSMFWFRVAALSGLDRLALDSDDFEEELGQVDGTLAHALERLVAIYAQERGYSMQELA